MARRLRIQNSRSCGVTEPAATNHSARDSLVALVRAQRPRACYPSTLPLWVHHCRPGRAPARSLSDGLAVKMIAPHPTGRLPERIKTRHSLLAL